MWSSQCQLYYFYVLKTICYIVVISLDCGNNYVVQFDLNVVIKLRCSQKLIKHFLKILSLSDCGNCNKLWLDKYKWLDQYVFFMCLKTVYCIVVISLHCTGCPMKFCFGIFMKWRGRKFKILRPLYEVKLLILPTRAHFQPEIPTYLPKRNTLRFLLTLPIWKKCF